MKKTRKNDYNVDDKIQTPYVSESFQTILEPSNAMNELNVRDWRKLIPAK